MKYNCTRGYDPQFKATATSLYISEQRNIPDEKRWWTRRVRRKANSDSDAESAAAAARGTATLRCGAPRP